MLLLSLTFHIPVLASRAIFVIVVLVGLNNAKFRTKPRFAFDKNQEDFPLAFFLILLNVSGVIPNIEAKYCKGT